MAEAGKKLKISISGVLKFQNRMAQTLRHFAHELRSGAEIPPAGRSLLADILEELAAGKTLKADVTKRGPRTQPKGWWIAADYTIHRMLGEKDNVALQVTRLAWRVSESTVRAARSKYYSDIRAALEGTLLAVPTAEIVNAFGVVPSRRDLLTAFREQQVEPLRQAACRSANSRRKG